MTTSPRDTSNVPVLPTDRSLDRRSLLRGGVFLGGSLAGSALLGSAHPAFGAKRRLAATTLPLVTPLSAKGVRANFGYCAHPAFQQSSYQHIEEWMARLADMGVAYFRGLYVGEGNEATARAVAAARLHGIKWLMTVTPEVGASLETTRARVNHIAKHAADVCKGIEGMNEPQHARGDGEVIPENWAAICVSFQRVIWETVKANPSLSHVKVVGPSLHDVMAAKSYTDLNPFGGARHYHQLAAAGIKQYQHYAGMHRYPADDLPLTGMTQRLGLVHSAYGDTNYPVWFTEWGYQNALATTGGHKPVDELTAALYAPRAILQFARLGYPLTRYELLDDPDAGAKDDQQSNFGAFRVTSTTSTDWQEKPEVGSVRTMLNALEDPGPEYTPEAVGLKVTGQDIDFVVTAKRDGTATVWMWRELPVWNDLATINVDRVLVTVVDRAGTRTIEVGAAVRKLVLR